MSALHAQTLDGGLRLRIEGSLTIADVTPLRAEMLKALTEPEQPLQKVWLDLQKVGEADSAGVQLLLSTALWLRSTEVAPVLSGASAGVDQVARAMGAADEAHCCGFARIGEHGGQP